MKKRWAQIQTLANSVVGKTKMRKSMMTVVTMAVLTERAEELLSTERPTPKTLAGNLSSRLTVLGALELLHENLKPHYKSSDGHPKRLHHAPGVSPIAHAQVVAGRQSAAGKFPVHQRRLADAPRPGQQHRCPTGAVASQDATTAGRHRGGSCNSR